MIYLDNSSTTHKKPIGVIWSQLLSITKNSINPSRAGYKSAQRVSEKIFNARELFAETFNTTADNVIFTSGCTMALNTAIFGTAKKNGHIITTVYEHNSVMRALEKIKSTQSVTYSVVTPNKNGQITASEIQKHIRPNTYMVIVNHTSNVTGTTQNIESIGKLCKKHKLLFLVDGAQSVGHEQIDMQKFNINLLSVAGHKGLYAPEGIGALLINNASVAPLLYGGTGTYSDQIKQPVEPPEGLESGTSNIPGILGMYAGLKFVNRNFKKINSKIYKLTSVLIDELKTISGVKLFSTNKHSGVVSFVVKGKDSSEVSNILNEEYNIATRPGLHCAPLVHKYMGTLKNGMTRISISYFNKMSDIKKAIVAIKKIASN